MNSVDVFVNLESEVRSYCRQFPELFTTAKGSFMYDSNNREYIDFLSGAGALNLGHNNDFIKNKLIEYIRSDGVSHGLDLYTSAKREFLIAFSQEVLAPRSLPYKIQFCGPTGANAVEAALKLARKVTKRSTVFSFMGGYHGMSLGAISVTSNVSIQESAGLLLSGVAFLPYPGGSFESFDSISYLEKILADDHSGHLLPAAIVLETVQAEGGVNVAPIQWLKDLRAICDKYGILLICDEIQTGYHRTGPFFSFERAGIVPDLVLVSKSISGYGLPMSLLLIRSELDIWTPGEHNGTFRGNQLAFVAARAALEQVRELNLESQVAMKGTFIRSFFAEHLNWRGNAIQFRGLGMIWGIDLSNSGGREMAKRVSLRCFEKGLIVETAGRNSAVLKLLPPLTIEQQCLEKGCAILYDTLVTEISEKPQG